MSDITPYYTMLRDWTKASAENAVKQNVTPDRIFEAGICVGVHLARLDPVLVTKLLDSVAQVRPSRGALDRGAAEALRDVLLNRDDDGSVLG